MFNERPTLNQSVTSLKEDDRALFEFLFRAADIRGVSSSSPTQNIIQSMIEIPSRWNWSFESVNEFIRTVNQFNEKSKFSTMEIIEFRDAEIEYDRDRTYPACVIFKMTYK